MFGGESNFSSAAFKSEAHFRRATFVEEADFSSTTFEGKAYFRRTIFERGADFGLATFRGKAVFRRAKIDSYLRFAGLKKSQTFTVNASLDLQLAQAAKPENVIFHTVQLRPQWFVNVDCRKFEFTDVKWVEQDKLQALSKTENHHRLLSIAYRQLATNAEDNNRYGEAARFRYASMDARRLERWRGWDIFTLDWWYWLVSGYGERIPRAAICLLVLLLGFSFLFTKVGFETKASPEVVPIVQEMMPTPPQPKALPLPFFCDGLTSAMSAALFQRPEPKAYTFWAKTCVALEMIFVPLQAALLALAIRRRFMR